MCKGNPDFGLKERCIADRAQVGISINSVTQTGVCNWMASAVPASREGKLNNVLAALNCCTLPESDDSLLWGREGGCEGERGGIPEGWKREQHSSSIPLWEMRWECAASHPQECWNPTKRGGTEVGCTRESFHCLKLAVTLRACACCVAPASSTVICCDPHCHLMQDGIWYTVVKIRGVLPCL